MVTGDEYLQLRAILAKVPGARLYAFKQNFDRGYSLELRIGHNEPGTITHLLPDGTQKWMYMLGVEQGGAGDHIPVAMNLEIEKKFSNREQTGMIRYLTSTQSNSDVNFFKLSPSEVEKDLLVYVNREPVSLSLNRKARLEGFIATDETEMVNDVDVLGLTTSDWPKVVTEGRQMPTPRQRIMDILHIGASSSEMKLYRSNYRRNHTYRQWFENLELPGTDGSDGTGMARRYNDQFAQLDFLLDTDFGPNSLIQVAHRTDEPGGMIVVQVIDDTPKRMIEASLLDDQKQTLNIYLKRLPTPEEIEFIRPYLINYPGYELLLYQSCTDKPGNYTLHIGKEKQGMQGYSDWEAGSVFARPKQLQLTRYGRAETTPTVIGSVKWPEDAPNRNVLIELDGQYIGVPERDVPNYDQRKMDQPIAIESLRCKLGLTPKSSSFFSGEWHFINYSVYPEMMEHLESALANEGLIDRPRQYFIEEDEVSRSTFADYPGDTGAYVQLGALKNDSGGTVVFQLIK
jgi:hypothetical protein